MGSSKIYFSFLFVALLPLVFGALSEDELANCRADIAFVLDGSGSVKLDNWKKMLEFVWKFAAELPFGPDGNHFGVVTFGNDAIVNIDLADFTSYEQFKIAVDGISYKDENTNTADGIRKLRSLFGPGKPGDRAGIPNIGIILTDGLATREVEFTQSEAAAARVEGINLFGIGIGAQLTMTELKAIIANDEQVFTVVDFDDLLKNVDTIVGQACADGPPIPPPEDPCYKKDLIFVLDASGSVEDHQFEHAKKFVKDFLNVLPLGPETNQVGLVIYSTESFVKMKLGEKKSHQEIFDVVDKLELIKQRTNLTGALKTVKAMFASEFDRPDAENVAVVITDCQSNTDEDLLPMESWKLHLQTNIRLFAIGLDKEADQFQMNLIASSPKYHHTFMLDTYEELSAKPGVSMIMDAVCLARYPSKDFDLDTEACYSDIIFAIDASKDLVTFNKEKEVVKKLATKLGGSCLYGVVVMGRQGYSAVQFDSYEGFGGFLRKVDNIPFYAEDTNMASGIAAAKNMFVNRPEGISLGKMHIRGIRGIRGVRGVRGVRADQDTFYTEAGVRALPLGLSARSSSLLLTNDLSEMLVIISEETQIVNSREQVLAEASELKEMMPYVGIMLISVDAAEHDMALLEGLVSKPLELFTAMEHDYDTLLLNAHIIAEAISSATALVQYMCNFERKDELNLPQPDTCDMVQDEDDDFDWFLGSGPTPSSETGPEGAFNGTYYAYIEASQQEPGNKAVLSALYFDEFTAGVVCLGFYYNMHGWHTGKLEVFERDEEGKERVHWMMSGPKGTEWKLGMVQMKALPGTTIGFRAVRAVEFSGDIALDAVYLHYGACPVVKQFPHVGDHVLLHWP